MQAKRWLSLLLSAVILFPSAGTLAAERNIMEASTVTLQAVTAEQNEEKTYDYLRKQGFTTAAVCGVLANIQKESYFNPNTIGDHGTSYGICQWHNDRWDRLKEKQPKNWKSLEGQLKYLVYELKKYYPHVYKKLTSVPNTAQGAYDAGHYWCYYFEIPANRAEVAVDRGNLARNFYWADYSKQEMDKSTCRHTYGTPSIQQATETNYGLRTFTCTSCKNSYSERTPVKVTWNAVKGKKTTIEASWIRSAGADGYQIQSAENSSFSVNKKSFSLSETSKTIHNMKRNTRYYIRIRAYCYINGEKAYSGWTGPKEVVTK